MYHRHYPSQIWWTRGIFCPNPLGKLIPRYVMTAIAVLMATAIGTPGYCQTEPDAIGPGMAGRFYAMAFDPTNDDVVFAGGDVCEVYRSDDGGHTWVLWSKGMQPNTHARAFYVEDLLVINGNQFADPNWWGVYAATQAGVYFRPISGNSWSLLTPLESFSFHADYGSSSLVAHDAKMGRNIGFSSLVFEEQSGRLLAGAGTARQEWAYANEVGNPSTDLDFYPEIASQFYTPMAATPSAQYSLWEIPLDGTETQLQPVPESVDHGLVHDLATTVINGNQVTVIATSQSLWMIPVSQSGPWVDMEATHQKTLPSGVDWSGNFWGVDYGFGGTLYVLCRRDESLALGPGVFVCQDPVGGGEFRAVGENVLSDFVPPFDGNHESNIEVPIDETMTWQQVLDLLDGDLAQLSVKSGTVDEIYVGASPASPESSTEGSGIYKYGNYISLDGSTNTGWVKILTQSKFSGIWNDFTYCYFDPKIQIPNGLHAYDPGWISNWAIPATVPMAWSPSNPDRMIAQLYHAPVITENDGTSWSQNYTEMAGSGWVGTGLRMMGGRTCSFLEDGRLFLGARDPGGFISTGPQSNSFEWLDWYHPANSTNDHIMVSEVIGNEIFVIKNRPPNSGFEKTDFVVARFDETAPFNSTRWEYISQGIESLYSTDYFMTDIEIINPSQMIASCYSKGGDTWPWYSRLFQGNLVNDQWEWSSWVASTDSIVGRITDLELIPGTSRLLATSNTNGRGGYGALYCFDLENHGTIDEWLKVTSTPTPLEEASRVTLCVKSDKTGSVVYVGTGGFYSHITPVSGLGTVLRVEGPFDSIPQQNDWTILANIVEDSFNFGTDWFHTNVINSPIVWNGPLEHAKRMTQVENIEIDPNNPMIIYAGLEHFSNHTSNGVWKFENGAWTQWVGGSGEGPHRGVTCLAINPDPELNSQLIVGTRGQEYFDSTIPVSPVPLVHSSAQYSISPDGGHDGILAVYGTSAIGDTLAEVFVDATVLGGPIRLYLNDDGPAGDGSPSDHVEGDGVWSAPLVDPITASPGTFYLPIVARDADFNTYIGTLQVQVLDLPPITFEDKSENTGHLYSAPPDTAMPYASAAFDYDADEKQDLFVSYADTNGYLFRNANEISGVPDFADRTGFDFPFEAGPESDQKGVVVAQFGTDSIPDFFVAHPTTPQLFLREDLSGVFVDMADSLFSSLPVDSYDAAWMDYDMDGLIDLAVARSNQPEDATKAGDPGVGIPSWLFHHEVNNGEHSLELVWDNNIFPQENHFSYEVIWCNVDGKDANDKIWPDLFICDLLPQQSGSLLINQGEDANGVVTFKNETTAWFPPAALPKGVRSAVFADFDNDGDDDLATCSWGQEDNLTIYTNTGSGFSVADKAAKSIPVEVFSPNGLAVGDYDGNGLSDLMVQPYYDNKEPYVLLNGLTGPPGVFSKFASLGLGISRVNGTAVADWGNDGDLDLYLGRTPGSGSFFYKNELVQGASAVPYVKIKLRGGGGENGAGIGSKVEILDSGFEANKTLWSKNGRNVQPLELIFPMEGFSGSTVNVRVNWPSGHVQDQACSINGLTTILDDSYIIDDTTVASDYRPSPTGNDWEFEWVTKGPTLSSEDYVTITGTTDVNSPCYCEGIITLDENYPNVDVTVVPETGGWRHTLVWHDGCCVVRKPACVYHFDVGSGNSLGLDTSINHTFKKMRVCGSGF